MHNYGGHGKARVGRPSLREEAWKAVVSSEKEWLAELAGVLESCQALDATEAFSYFWDETPNEQTFSMTDIGPIILPEPLSGSGRGSSALFVEADAPRCGLGWSLFVDGDGRAGITSVGKVNAVAAKKGVANVAMRHTPGAIGMEPGLVKRAGALLYMDEGPFSGSAKRFYGRLAGKKEVGKWSGVLQMMPFARLDEEISGGSLQTPQVIYYMPLGLDGGVRPQGADEAMPMVIPDVDPSEADGESIGSIMAKGHRPLHLAALFSVVCAGARGTHRGSWPQLRMGRQDSCGWVRRLLMKDLARSLEERGRASELGLSHALTVCRDEFSAAASRTCGEHG